jgi:hypothetical protein
MNFQSLNFNLNRDKNEKGISPRYCAIGLKQSRGPATQCPAWPVRPTPVVQGTAHKRARPAHGQRPRTARVRAARDRRGAYGGRIWARSSPWASSSHGGHTW